MKHRANLIKGLFIVVIMLIILSVAPVGCAPEEGPPPEGPEGTLTIAIPDLGNEVWPGNKSEYQAMCSAAGVWGHLLRRATDGSIIPNLAEKWERTADGMTWTFDLRQGIQFHDDWGEFTAEDVKFTYEQTIAEDSLNYRIGFFREDISSVEVVNPHRVVFHMSKPDWALPYYMTQFPPVFCITSKEYFDTIGETEAMKHPIGTGSFRFVEHKLGDYIKLEAVDNHWRQTADVKTVIVRKVPEEATRIVMLKAGEIDITEVTPEFRGELEGVPDLRLILASAKSTQLYLFGQYLHERPTYDPTVPWALLDEEKARKVRQAMDLAINKQEIIEYIYGGMGELPLPFPFWPDHACADPAAWTPYALGYTQHDPEKAKQLLAEAGYPDPSEVKVNMLMVEFFTPVNLDMMEAVGMYWEKIGITVEYEAMDLVSHMALADERNEAGYVWGTWSSYEDEPVTYIIGGAHSELGWGGWCEYPQMDKIMYDARAELDDAKRTAMQRQMGQWMYDEVWIIPIGYMSATFGVSAKVKEWPYWPRKMREACDLEYLKLAR